MQINTVGFVAIGRNEAARLGKCLASIQSISDAIIYVDSGSTDDSIRIAENMGVSVIRLEPDQPFTAARARNEGFAALMAKYENLAFVQFIDSDCELVGGWIEAGLKFLEHKSDAAIVCGRRREQHPETSIYNRLCDIEWNTFSGESESCGGDAMVRAKAFKAVGGFRQRLIAGEEPEMCVRMRQEGWHIWRIDEEMTRHDAAITRLGQWWARAVRSGYGYAEVARLHKNSQFTIYNREVKRAVFWGGFVPLAICGATMISRFSLLVVTVYAIPILRVWLFQRPKKPLAYAFFVMLAKFAELQGIVMFHVRKARGRGGVLIEYK